MLDSLTKITIIVTSDEKLGAGSLIANAYYMKYTHLRSILEGA